MLFFPVAFAFADDAPAAQASGPMSSIVSMAPLVILFVVFYFLLIRPQQKKAKEHKEMLGQIAAGDSVITNGGIHGRVTGVNEDSLTVEIAPNVRVKVSKEAIAAKKKQG